MNTDQRRSWTDELIAEEARRVAQSLGHFPSAQELRQLGRNDLACVIGKRGGFLRWADRIGIARHGSDSDTGWEGEEAVRREFLARGIFCVRSKAIKAPFDLLAQEVLKIDVKSARFAEYGGKSASRGWFYRVGKICQADLVIFYQLDTSSFYAVPWWKCPTTNLTIPVSGGQWKPYLNDWNRIRRMIGLRMAERARDGEPVAEVA